MKKILNILEQTGYITCLSDKQTGNKPADKPEDDDWPLRVFMLM